MNATTNPAPKSFADVLGCDDKAARKRLAFLGVVETCGRCAGSGRYSFNLMDGDRCYGCAGSGKRIPRFSAKLGRQVAALVAAGALEPYFARNRALAAAKRQIAPMVAEANAIHEEISQAYSVACRWERTVDDGAELFGSPLFRAQTMNNSLYWGGDENYRHATGARRIEDRVNEGKLDALTAVARLREVIDLLAELRAAWRAV